ncbi:MAG: nuclear transport factor 2 family protein [Pseudomonadota bacterium]
MDDKNTREFAEKLMDAFKSGGVSALTDFYHADYVNQTPFPGAPTTLEGHVAFVTAAAPHLEFVSTETVEIVPGEDTLSILSKSRFRVKESGEDFEAFGFAVVRLKEGKIIENWGGYDPVGFAKMHDAGVVIPID